MTKGQEIAEKIRRGAFIAFSCGDDIVELDSSAAEDVDAAIAEARHDQALADCRVVCDGCAAGEECKFDGPAMRLHVHQFKVDGRDSKRLVLCRANKLYAAYKAATGRELK